MYDKILIIDYGSQYTQLIARKVRELKVYCLVLPYHKISKHSLILYNPKGIILSGGPNSVTDKSAPKLNQNILNLRIPILGICYGLQLICQHLGGKISKSKKREYGHAYISITNKSNLLTGLKKKNNQVWMSHGDHISKIPNNFKITSKSNNKIISSIENNKKRIYGLQFHPEVFHTEKGKILIKNFLFKICNIKNKFKIKDFIDNKIKQLKNELKDQKVICGISGGVDSTVTAFLLKKAIGDNLYCIFVNHGLLRKNEDLEVTKIFKNKFNKNFININCSKLFISRLSSVEDPEQKRKIIGNTFIEVFEKESKKIKNVKFLAQGTLYPDVIESVPFFGGPTAKIKSHHNVGGLPKKMKLNIIEPLRELFKDEVRSVGKNLKINKKLLNRHPFPGPGLAIRIPGKIDPQKVKMLQEIDYYYLSYLKEQNLYNKIWQAFAVLLPVKSVGVMGDERTYNYAVSIRAVTSVDGMTANFYMFSKKNLSDISSCIINNVSGVNRVLFDFTSKPPGTIEWE